MTLMIHLLKKRKKLILILNHSGLSIQFILLKIVNQRFFHIIKEIMHGTQNNIKTLLRNRGKLQLQVECHLQELMLNRKKPQSTQLKTVNQKYFHITSVITPGILNNTKTLLRNHGKLQRQLVCHLQEPMLNRKKPQSTQLKTVNQKFFHIIKEITPGILNNTKILLRNHGKLQRQLVCHLLELMHNRKINQSTQLKIVNPKFFHIINVIMHGILNNTKTLLRSLGKLQLLLECH
jgi:hypothetical protein